jgi:hypothetical protein
LFGHPYKIYVQQYTDQDVIPMESAKADCYLSNLHPQPTTHNPFYPPLLPTPKPTYPTTNQPHSTLTTHLSLINRSKIHYSQGNAMTSGRILHLALHATSGTKRRRSRGRQTTGTRRHCIKRFNRREAAAGYGNMFVILPSSSKNDMHIRYNFGDVKAKFILARLLSSGPLKRRRSFFNAAM